MLTTAATGCASRRGAGRLDVRGVGELVAAEEVKGGAVQATVRVSVEIEGSERPACVADPISRFVPA